MQLVVGECVLVLKCVSNNVVLATFEKRCSSSSQFDFRPPSCACSKFLKIRASAFEYRSRRHFRTSPPRNAAG